MTAVNSALPGAARTVSIPDPRARTVEREGRHFVLGMACAACGHKTAVRVPWCPRCQSETTERAFGPDGTVWSATVVHIKVADRQPPYALAYVDLDEGPRVLAHVSTARPPAVGSRVRLTAPTPEGDIQVEPS